MESLVVMIRNCQSLAHAVQAVGEFYGRPLERVDDPALELYRTRTLGFSMTAYASEFENDYGIDFEAYPVAVGFDVWRWIAPSPYFEDWFRLNGLVLAEALHRVWGFETMVVGNLSQVLARFPATDIPG
jgi:hypothetical protein